MRSHSFIQNDYIKVPLEMHLYFFISRSFRHFSYDCTILFSFSYRFFTTSPRSGPHRGGKAVKIRGDPGRVPLTFSRYQAATRRRIRILRQIWTTSAVAHSLSARLTTAASMLRGRRLARGHMWESMMFSS